MKECISVLKFSDLFSKAKRLVKTPVSSFFYMFLSIFYQSKIGGFPFKTSKEILTLIYPHELYTWGKYLAHQLALGKTSVSQFWCNNSLL